MSEKIYSFLTENLTIQSIKYDLDKKNKKSSWGLEKKVLPSVSFEPIAMDRWVWWL